MIQTMSMSSSMASLFSPPPSTHSLHTLSRPNTFLAHKPYHNQHFLSSKFKKPRDILFCAVSGNEEAPVGTTIVAEEVPVGTTTVAEEAEVGTTNAAVGTTIVAEEVPVGTTTVAEDLPLDTTNAAVGTTTVAEEAEVGTTNAAVGTTNAAVGTTDAAEEVPAVVEKGESLSSNGSVPAPVESAVLGVKFEDPKWVNGTWNLSMFQKDGKTDWDAVIDAEARRRKWLETNPESSSNDEPVMFDTSTIPWWAWMKRFHLPEAELLNGRAAMVGFFMAYFVDSLTGVGLVDQMGNFFCKTLLFIAVAGVLLIRKNEDLENLKKLLEETTFYDKQWQATWQDESSNNTKNKQ